MNQLSRLFCLCAGALVASLLVSACGGGDATPPTPAPNAPAAGAVADTVPPTVTISDSVAGATATGDVTYTFTFSEDVGISFTADDVVVTGGAKGTFLRPASTVATLVVSPPANSTGTISVSVAAGTFKDLAGNANTAGASAQRAFNSVPPTCVGGGGGVIASGTTVITFDEATAPILTDFGGEMSSIVADPAGGSNKVLKIVKPVAANLWAGTTVSNGANQSIPKLPFAATATKMSVRVCSPAVGIHLRLKVEDAADATHSVETEAVTTVANGWETLTFDFSTQAAGTAALNLAYSYNKLSVFPDFGKGSDAPGNPLPAERTYLVDSIVFLPAAAGSGGSSTAVVTFDEATPPTLTAFGGETSSIAADPAGGSNKVLKIIKHVADNLWAGTTVSNGANQSIPKLAFSAGATKMTVRAYSPAVGIHVRLKVEDAADGTHSVETEAVTTVANGWETLTFDFSTQAAGTAALNLAYSYNKVSVFPDFGKGSDAPGNPLPADRTYYIDDITFLGASSGGGGATSTKLVTFDEATAPTLTDFGGETSSIAADPAAAGNKVLKIIKHVADNLWAGTTVSNGANQSIPKLAFSASATKMTVRAYSPAVGIHVRLKVEDAADATHSVETEAVTTVANGWETLTFDFSTQAAGTAALNLAYSYNKVSVFPDFGKGSDAPGNPLPADRTYYFDDITFLGSASGTGGGAGTVVFSSGYTKGNTTAQGGAWGYFSGDFSSYSNTFTGGGFADSTPSVADANQYFYISVTTTAPTAPVTGANPTSGGYVGMYVTYPGAGLTLSGQTSLVINLGVDSNFFKQTSNKSITLFIVGATTYSNGSGGNCNLSVTTSVVPTTDAMTAYTIPLSQFTLAQGCNGGGFTAGVTSAAQALAQPIGAVNSQLTYPNVNTTVNSGTSGAPVYATGLTRGLTQFK